MNEHLKNYINDTENPLYNFELGRWYEDQNHHSPAAGFFLRAADLCPDDLDLRYESLLRTYFCYNRAGNRNYTCESILKSAVIIAPDRPEAYYFLSEHYEKLNDWPNSYLFSSLGLEFAKNPTKFRSYMYFDSMCQLYFQKGKSSWWMGKSQESRDIYKLIVKNYHTELTKNQSDFLQERMSSLGAGLDHETIKQYTKKDYERYKFKFPGLENIENNFSQIYQDMFVLSILEGKRSGTYLEVGSAKPIERNNTFLLEQQFDWRGVGIEQNSDLCLDYSSTRRNRVLNMNALEVNYKKLLEDNFGDDRIIDYLQLDIEPAKNTFETLLSIPLEQYQFRVITFEHDYYADVTQSYREKSRRYLKSMGYELLAQDLCAVKGCSFEDWWVKPELINSDILAQMKSKNDAEATVVTDYMLNPL